MAKLETYYDNHALCSLKLKVTNINEYLHQCEKNNYDSWYYIFWVTAAIPDVENAHKKLNRYLINSTLYYNFY